VISLHRLKKMLQSQHPDSLKALHGTLLNFSVVAAFLLSCLLMLYIFVSTDASDVENVWRGMTAVVMALCLTIVVLRLNHRGHLSLAAWVYLIGCLVVTSSSDAPRHLIEGRSTIMYAVLIVLASAVTTPAASILMAALVSLAVYGLAWSTGLVWSPIGLSLPITTSFFFLIATITWLITRRLEQAIMFAQDLNQTLDFRVNERTRELNVANQRLVVLNDRLLEHDRLRRAFVSMVSHDLRSPLVGILSNTEMLNLNVYGTLTDNQSGAIRRIAQNARSLLRLVNDLLDQTQIEAGQILSLRPVPFSPADLLTEMVTALGDLAQAKGLQLTFHLGDDLPPVLIGDPQRLLQILINLAANAIKFTDVGFVHVELARQAATQWRMRITDTGRGISATEQARIFEPFHRGVAANQLPGAGLGLSIVKHLVDLMNGEIQVASEEQHGSSFTIILVLVLPEHVSG
jgi:signal transduction histidine kinase